MQIQNNKITVSSLYLQHWQKVWKSTKDECEYEKLKKYTTTLYHSGLQFERIIYIQFSDKYNYMISLTLMHCMQAWQMLQPFYLSIYHLCQKHHTVLYQRTMIHH